METLLKDTSPVNRLQRAHLYAEKVPGAIEGQGGDKATFALACKLIGEPFHLSGNDALAVMREWNRKCVPPWSETALARKITCAGRPVSCSGKSAPKWPQRDETRIAIARQTRVSIERLHELSPVVYDGDGPHTEQYIDCLFPGNPLLCCGTTQFEFATKPRNEWRGQLASMAFIVPSPMSDVMGWTKAGELSEHSLDNTGPRRHLVVEFDRGSKDEHASILIHLAHYAPLVLALSSGGKSIHGWFRCQDIPEAKLERFMAYAVALGGDHMLWTRSQFVRMPDGRRDNGVRQRVIFHNPKGVMI